MTEADIAPYTPRDLLTLVDIHQMAGLALARGRRAATARVAARALASASPSPSRLVSPALWGRQRRPIDAWLALSGDRLELFFPLSRGSSTRLVGFAFGARSSDVRSRAFVRRTASSGSSCRARGRLTAAATARPRGRPTGASHRRPARDPRSRAQPGSTCADIVVRAVAGRPHRRHALGWSRRVTSMYCVHWILIGWGAALVGHRELELRPVRDRLADRIHRPVACRDRGPDATGRAAADAGRPRLIRSSPSDRGSLALLGAMCIAFSGSSTATRGLAVDRDRLPLPVRAAVPRRVRLARARGTAACRGRRVRLAAIARRLLRGRPDFWHHAIELVGAGLSTVLGQSPGARRRRSSRGCSSGSARRERCCSPSRSSLVGVVLISGLIEPVRTGPTRPSGSPSALPRRLLRRVPARSSGRAAGIGAAGRAGRCSTLSTVVVAVAGRRRGRRPRPRPELAGARLAARPRAHVAVARLRAHLGLAAPSAGRADLDHPARPAGRHVGSRCCCSARRRRRSSSSAWRWSSAGSRWRRCRRGALRGGWPRPS